MRVERGRGDREGPGPARPGAKDTPFLTLFSLSLSLLPEQEAASSFAQWEALIRGRGSSQEGDPFAEVMTLVTHMYKQTAIAKVTQTEVIVIVIVILLVTTQLSWWNLLSAQVPTLRHNMFQTCRQKHSQTNTKAMHPPYSFEISVCLYFLTNKRNFSPFSIFKSFSS